MTIALTGGFGGSSGLATTLSAITWTAPHALHAGDWVVAVVACDNTTVTDLPSSNTIANVSCNGINFQKAGEYTNAQAATNAGATVGTFYLNVTSAIEATGLLSANALFTVSINGLASHICVTAEEGTVSLGASLTVAGLAVNSTDGASVSALTLGGLAAATEYMYIAALAGEETVGAAYTASTGYTAMSRRGIGTTAATSMGIHGEIKIESTAQSIFAPTTIATDWVTTQTAFKEFSPAIILTHSIDAILQKSISLTINLDAILKGMVTKTAGLDAKILSQIQETLSVDAVLQRAIQKTVILDAVLQSTVTKTLAPGLDAVLQGLVSQTASLHALIQRMQSLSMSVDAIINMVDANIELTARLDALLTQTWRPITPSSIATWAPATPAT